MYATKSKIPFIENLTIDKAEKFSGKHPVPNAKETINIKAVLYGNKDGTAHDNPSNILAFSIWVLFLKSLSINLLINDIAAVLFDIIKIERIIVNTDITFIFSVLLLFSTLFSIYSSNIFLGINSVKIERKIRKTTTPKMPSIPEIIGLSWLNISLIPISPKNNCNY